ncbi:ADP-ribosylation factor GTPase-activating protein effector protein 2 [Monosporozyma unispora]|nr:hypothetical protein C6P44_002436 [Kazachstania unispora]
MIETNHTPNNVNSQLQTLLKYPGNLKCADCKLQLHPRWASWSLGVLICIKCAGIHRSLGTHISKVKSIDLDSWTSDNLYQFIVNGDNERVNSLYYENKIDTDLENLDLTDNETLGQFIKDKYETQKWVSDTPLTPAKLEEITVSPTKTPTPSSTIESQTDNIPRQIAIPQTNLSNMIHLNSLHSIKKSSPSNQNNNNNIQSHNKTFIKRSIYELYTTTK